MATATKTRGTWIKLHEDIHRHPKTIAFADHLANGCSQFGALPAPFRRAWCAAAIHKLACWCLRESDEGRLDHLHEDLLSGLVEFPYVEQASALWSALLASGFVDQHECGAVTLHEFEAYAKEVLRKRKSATANATSLKGASSSGAFSAPLTENGKRKAEDGSTTKTPLPPKQAQDREEGTSGKQEQASTKEAQGSADKPDPGELIALWEEVGPDCTEHRLQRASGGVEAGEVKPEVRRAVAKALGRKADLEWWREVFAACRDSDFLAGRKTDFAATLFWAVGPRNVEKIRAGEYGNRGRAPRTKGEQQMDEIQRGMALVADDWDRRQEANRRIGQPMAAVGSERRLA